MTSTATPPTATTGTARTAGTGTRATRVIGAATIVMMGWLVAFGLGFSPADRDQEDAVRIMYVHVPTVWVAYLAFTVTAVCSALYLFSQEALARLRPLRRGERRDRRGVHGTHAGHRFDVGPHHLGRLLAVGRPPHHHGAAVRQLHRLPRRPRSRRQPPAARQAQRRDRPAGRARDPARALLGAHVAQPPPGRVGARPRRRRHARRPDAVQPVRRRGRVHACSTSGCCCTAPARSRWKTCSTTRGSTVRSPPAAPRRTRDDRRRAGRDGRRRVHHRELRRSRSR